MKGYANRDKSPWRVNCMFHNITSVEDVVVKCRKVSQRVVDRAWANQIFYAKHVLDIMAFIISISTVRVPVFKVGVQS